MSAAIAVGLAGYANAQDPAAAPPFPVVNDLPEGWDMDGKGMPLDVLGAKIGMPRAEAVSSIAAGLEIDPATGHETGMETGVGDQYGVQVFFGYVQDWYVGKYPADGTKDWVGLYFTTGVTGERLTGIARTTEWPQGLQPRKPDIEKALVDKYGPPSFSQQSRHYWVFHKGAKYDFDAAIYDTLRRPTDEPVGCVYRVNGALTYNYEPVPPPGSPLARRGDAALQKDCNVVLMATLGGGSAEGLVGKLEISVAGFKRFYESAIATDVFLDEALAEKAAGSSGPSTAPKL
jgi:hypothetical protein